MPTGYTAGVQDGSVRTLRDFALRCARNFGATIMQRDDAMDVPPAHREVSDYYKRCLAGARERLKNAQDMTEDAAGRVADEEHTAAMRSFFESRDKAREERRRYMDMRRSVEAWQPPTPDHAGLKTFMLSQLDESIKFDCGPDRDPPTHRTGAQWLAETRADAAKSVALYEVEHAKEVARCAEANAWIDALYASLASPLASGVV